MGLANMKCAIYARVSTDEQGTSIINQQEYFKDYIERNKFEIFDIYSDEAFSGTEASKRLSFQRLLEDGKNKRYDVLLAKSYSRFGRNQRETLTALSQLFENGIRIVFVEDGLDSLRDKGQFGLFAWLAEQESRKLSERIKMTWQIYNKDGKIHNTKETYGYNYSPAIKNFVVNEQEAETVKLIFNMYLKGAGTMKIAKFLNEKGISSKYKKRWGSTRITEIVTNNFYLGHLTQGKMQSIDVTIKKLEHLDKSKWYVHKNNHEAIISEETFQKAQDEVKKRSDYLKSFKAVRHSERHLFSNLVKCKMCGSSCNARKRKTGYEGICYSCREYDSHGKKVCGHMRNAINEKDLIKFIKFQLEELSANNFHALRGYYSQANADKRKERAKTDVITLDKQIEEQTRLGNSLLAVFTEGIIGKEQYKLQNDSIADKLNSLMSLREEALLEQNKLVVNVDGEGEMIKTVRHLLEIETSEWTNNIIKKVINKIHLSKQNNEVEIFFAFAISSN